MDLETAVTICALAAGLMGMLRAEPRSFSAVHLAAVCTACRLKVVNNEHTRYFRRVTINSLKCRSRPLTASFPLDRLHGVSNRQDGRAAEVNASRNVIEPTTEGRVTDAAQSQHHNKHVTTSQVFFFNAPAKPATSTKKEHDQVAMDSPTRAIHDDPLRTSTCSGFKQPWCNGCRASLPNAKKAKYM